jgi:hypothetical protein
MFETRVADLLQHAAGEYIHVRSSFPFFLGAFALSFAHFSLSLSLSSSVRVLYIYIFFSSQQSSAWWSIARRDVHSFVMPLSFLCVLSHLFILCLFFFLR